MSTAECAALKTEHQLLISLICLAALNLQS